MSLRTYHRKRNFNATTEPSVPKKKTASRKKSAALSFVVQEHHARNLHYDFRLEWHGVLKSWAIPKGPSLEPHVKRLAVEVEDHPLSYGSFEGTIPEHQYGAGEVFIWDKGTWIPKFDPALGLKKGHLEFELKGGKLKGSWDLIRTKIPGRQHQWLLIKKDDAYSENTAVKPLRKKNPRSSKSEKIFISPELAQLADAPPEGKNWLHELKFDGYRIQTHATGDKIKLYTRSGQDWTSKFPSLEKAFATLDIDNGIIDGEIVVLDNEGRSDFQLLQNAIKSKNTHHLYYYAFDLLSLGGKDLRSWPLEKRRDQLQQLLKKSAPQIRFSNEFKGTGKALLELARKHGLEGIISKRRDSTYRSERNPNWIKTKCTERQEFVIGGYTDAAGTRSHFGALLLGVYKRGKLHYVGRVGTGFTQQSLKELFKTLEPLVISESPFAVNSPKDRDVHWINPQLSAEVSFANWTNDGVLRAPVFHGLREDKPAHEIKKEHRPIRTPKISTERWPVSNPDKVLFAKEKIKKRDVADYYALVTNLILPQLEDRPLSLVRCPQGTSQKCFFQKHQTKPPVATTPVRMKEGTGYGIYMSIHDSAGLAELVQMNAFEIHCSNCRSPKTNNPDQFVIDFDPGPGVPWKNVIHAALELKDLLASLKLKSFVKLSGGKGLHVHVPIKSVYSWDQINSFTHALALHMEQSNPDLYVSKMSKNIRDGKIFVDYLRNSQGATAVSPYSLRAHAVSSVAMPVDWKDLSQCTGSDAYTLKKAVAHLKARKKDPWKGYRDLEQSIALLERSNNKSRSELGYLAK